MKRNAWITACALTLAATAPALANNTKAENDAANAALLYMAASKKCNNLPPIQLAVLKTVTDEILAETGITWEVHRHRSRLLQAIALLSDTDKPISDIAGRCGFESQSAFAKVFRDEMGEAPREYRLRTRDPAWSKPPVG